MECGDVAGSTAAMCPGDRECADSPRSLVCGGGLLLCAAECHRMCGRPASTTCGVGRCQEAPTRRGAPTPDRCLPLLAGCVVEEAVRPLASSATACASRRPRTVPRRSSPSATRDGEVAGRQLPRTMPPGLDCRSRTWRTCRGTGSLSSRVRDRDPDADAVEHTRAMMLQRSHSPRRVKRRRSGGQPHEVALRRRHHPARAGGRRRRPRCRVGRPPHRPARGIASIAARLANAAVWPRPFTTNGTSVRSIISITDGLGLVSPTPASPWPMCVPWSNVRGATTLANCSTEWI